MIFMLEDSVGFSRRRTGTGGRVRYTAVYRDLRGRQRSAGSFATRREADRVWHSEVRIGRRQHVQGLLLDRELNRLGVGSPAAPG